MTFNPLAAMCVSGLLDELPSNPTVMELGNQTFHVGEATMAKIAAALGRPLSSLPYVNGQDRAHSPEAYYKALGFASYAAIDVNSLYGSLVMDLNRDLRTDYGFTDTFDLVTNIGTGEHIFNQAALFKNAHDLTKVGGIMMHIAPNDWSNHGFFSYSPLLYGDLARANGYEIVRLSMAGETGYSIPPVSPVQVDPPKRPRWSWPWPKTPEISIAEIVGKPHKKPMKYALRIVAGKRKHWRYMCVAALRKTSDAPFAAPIQGVYADAIEDPAIAKNYVTQALPVNPRTVDRATRYRMLD
jgi:SAM-dependent methyltransferase